MELADLPLECQQLILEKITHKPTLYGPLHMYASVVEGAMARVTPWLSRLLLSIDFPGLWFVCVCLLGLQFKHLTYEMAAEQAECSSGQQAVEQVGRLLQGRLQGGQLPCIL